MSVKFTFKGKEYTLPETFEVIDALDAIGIDPIALNMRAYKARGEVAISQATAIRALSVGLRAAGCRATHQVICAELFSVPMESYYAAACEYLAGFIRRLVPTAVVSVEEESDDPKASESSPPQSS